MSHDNSDDGLMHTRDWEAEPTPWREEQPALPDRHAVADDGYDDGLVHDHGWACSERGRMAHR